MYTCISLWIQLPLIASSRTQAEWWDAAVLAGCLTCIWTNILLDRVCFWLKINWSGKVLPHRGYNNTSAWNIFLNFSTLLATGCKIFLFTKINWKWKINGKWFEIGCLEYRVSCHRINLIVRKYLFIKIVSRVRNDLFINKRLTWLAF